MSDFTHHKEAEQLLISTERKLLALFSTTNEAIILFDTDLRVKFFNQRFLHLPPSIKNPGNIAKGSTIEDLGLFFPPIEIKNMLEKTLNGSSQNRIFEIKKSNQGSYWWSLSTYPTLASQGSLLGVVLVIEEVTDEYVSNRAIYDRHNLLREMAQTHSHEVRKPLANVLGLLEMISNTSPEDDFDYEYLKSYLSNQILELDAIIQQLSKRNKG